MGRETWGGNGTEPPVFLYAGAAGPAALSHQVVDRLLRLAALAADGSAARVLLLQLEPSVEAELRRLLATVPGLQLESAPPGMTVLEDLKRRGDTLTAVVFGPERLREVRAFGDSERASGREAEVVPNGSGLDREAIVWELARLYDLTARLRRECPWDRKQTQQDIVTYTLEETYELVDAVRSGEMDHAGVRGELGDLLFQVYFLAYVAEQAGWYDLGEVADGIHRKLVRRHPHIFGDASAETAEDVKRTWDEIKKHSEGREGIFHEVPRSLPSPLLAQKLQQRAAAVGFDWRHAAEVLPKVHEELLELESALADPAGHDLVAREVGDLLFAVVNLARKLKVDPELELREAGGRFRARVEGAAQIAFSEGVDFEKLGLDEQETYYRRAKASLAAGAPQGPPAESGKRLL